MTDLYTWSATAASNNAASPDGYPESMLPSGLNDSGRETMRAVCTGTPVYFSTIADMRAITQNPGDTKKFVLLSTTSGTPLRWYKWLDTRTGSDNGTTIISPTASSLTAGAFEEIGHAYSANTLTDSTDPKLFISSINFQNNAVDREWTSLGEIPTGAKSTVKHNSTNLHMDSSNVLTPYSHRIRTPVGSITRVKGPVGITQPVSIMFDIANAAVALTESVQGNQLSLSSFYGHRGRHVAVRYLDTQGAAAADTLDTILISTAGVITGSLLILKAVNDARSIIVTSIGNIRLNGVAPFTLDNVNDTLCLIYGAATGVWKQVFASNNGA